LAEEIKLRAHHHAECKLYT